MSPNMVTIVGSHIHQFIKKYWTIVAAIMIYLMYIIIHFVAPHFYIYFCVPTTWKGFLLSPFMVPTPHCKAIRWTSQFTATNIEVMWVSIGSIILAKVVSEIGKYTEPKDPPKPPNNI
jgi:hypothetical protein